MDYRGIVGNDQGLGTGRVNRLSWNNPNEYDGRSAEVASADRRAITPNDCCWLWATDQTMQTFEITIQRQVDDTWPVVVIQSTTGVFLPTRREGILELDTSKLISASGPFEYGKLLGESLFRSSIRDAYVEALARSDDALHILLHIEDSKLRRLYWGRLCSPVGGRWDHLRLQQRTPYALDLPSVVDSRFPYLSRGDLKALIVVASPPEGNGFSLAPFDPARFETGIRKALGRFPAKSSRQPPAPPARRLSTGSASGLPPNASRSSTSSRTGGTTRTAASLSYTYETRRAELIQSRRRDWSRG
jgi:hypothetical protein